MKIHRIFLCVLCAFMFASCHSSTGRMMLLLRGAFRGARFAYRAGINDALERVGAQEQALKAAQRNLFAAIEDTPAEEMEKMHSDGELNTRGLFEALGEAARDDSSTENYKTYLKLWARTSTPVMRYLTPDKLPTAFVRNSFMRPVLTEAYLDMLEANKDNHWCWELNFVSNEMSTFDPRLTVRYLEILNDAVLLWDDRICVDGIVVDKWGAYKEHLTQLLAELEKQDDLSASQKELQERLRDNLACLEI